MSEILVYHKGKKFFNVPLESSRFTIGRSHENDLILTGDSISREHAVIENTNGSFILHDKSTHGTHINEEPVLQAVTLKDHDKITILDWQIEFCDTHSDTKQPPHQTQLTTLPQATTTDATKIIRFGDDGKTFKILNPMIILTDVAGNKTYVALRKKHIILGSGEDCDTIVKDETVSKNHVSIKITDKGFLVTDLDSTNGTLVNNARIKDMFIRDQQNIQIGRTTVTFCLTALSEEPLTPFAGNEFCGILGESAVMKTLFAQILKAASTDMTVIIHGESGSGKENVARALHNLSDRKDKPYVVINCGAITTSLIESELFGHEKGAFTGADQRHIGAFEQANGGTLFLDEIAELPLELQSKLLRVLEYQKIRRVGSTKEIDVNVRVITATHRQLSAMVQTQKFREDLFYRLFVLPLTVPPLRSRLEDLAILIPYFLKSATSDSLEIDPSAWEKLRAHSWPGNVRELKNTLWRAVAFCENKTLTANDIHLIPFFGHESASEVIKHSARAPLSDADAAEANRIRHALTETDGDKNKAAELLNMGRSTLFRKVKNLGLDV